ncbi:four-carbon acid sugar kinase family protein, partial [Lacticaseibacillus paracasei]
LWTDDIVKMLKKEFGSEVALAKTDTNDLSPRSSKVLVFDAITDEDLTVIAKFAQCLKKRILYVGSAGLAGALFQKSRIAKPSLAVVGSISETSLKQMAYAVDAGTA